MNLILFERSEVDRPLARGDRRAVHLLQVLRRREGDSFDVGVVDGPRGRATLVNIGAEALNLAFTWGAEPLPLDPITLIAGLPRPQTARDILRDATTLGVAAMHFVLTEKGDPGYAHSTLWTSGEWRRHLIAGAEQAFDTRLPTVTSGRRLTEILAALPTASVRLALDHYEATTPLSRQPEATSAAGRPAALVLAFGPERGWSNGERAALREAGFTLAHLGPRVLRMETAVTTALALVKAKRGAM